MLEFTLFHTGIEDGISMFREIFKMLKFKKKLWLLPLVWTLLILGVLFLLAGNSLFGPFIYTLF